MKIVILAYEGIDIWDLAIPYEIFRNIDGVEIVLAVNSEKTEITCKDKNLKIGGFTNIKDVDNADIFWICEGESSIHNLLKDEKLKAKLAALAIGAKKIVTIGAASVLFAGTCLGPMKSLCTHPSLERTVKKAKLNYSQDLILDNENFITMSSRINALLSVFLVIDEFFPAEERDRLFLKYNLDRKMFDIEPSGNNSKRNRLLKKLYKQTIKRAPEGLSKTVKIDLSSNSVAFYLQEGFNVLNFALCYSILSNYQQSSMFTVGDKIGKYYVEGGGFYVKADFGTQQLTRVHTLVLTGGDIINSRFEDTYLKYWISEIITKTSIVLALDNSERLLAVSGVLVDYDPVIEGDNGDGKFVFINDTGLLLNWLKLKLPRLTNPAQAELYLAEYYY